MIPSEGRWTFDSEAVASGFENHVREQLPWYDLATQAVRQVAINYLPEHGHVLDIGASTGNIEQALADILGSRNCTMTALEPSAEMRKRYQGSAKIESSKVESVSAFEPFDVAVLMLSLAFVPVSARETVISKLKQACKVGGTIIIVDKLETATGYPATVLNRLTLAGKAAQGATGDAILRKELALAGVQRPVARDLLHGFVPFFRYGDFEGVFWESHITIA